MSALQTAFAAALSVILVLLTAFTTFTVRSAIVARDSAARTGWISRIGRASDRDTQRWAFVAHRTTGVAVFAFLLLHVLDVGLYAISPSWFDDVHTLYSTAALRVFECFLLYAILFHTLNGLRLIALDLVDIRNATARHLLSLCIVVTLLLGTAAAVVILWPVAT
ncbi:MAG: succinate dehydrogenase, cytochrome b556 subunit [Gaiella sp.]|nr:succinate dehydrogenase, cytochrome b556 subunit [Gaiella sp.]